MPRLKVRNVHTVLLSRIFFLIYTAEHSSAELSLFCRGWGMFFLPILCTASHLQNNFSLHFLPVLSTDLKSWEFLVRMIDADEMTEDQLIGIIDAAGVSDRNRMDILAFEAVLDELTRVINDEEEEEEKEGEGE